MKIPLCILLVIFSCFNATAEDAINKIIIRGTAYEYVEPNEATINISITSKDESYNATIEHHNTASNSLMKVLYLYKIDNKDIKVEQFYIAPQYQNCNTTKEPSQCDPNKIIGYYAYKDYKIKITDISRLNDIMVSLLELEVIGINSINFTHSKLEELYNIVLITALQNAKTQAASLLNSIDLKLGEVLEINVQPSLFPLGNSSPMLGRSLKMSAATDVNNQESSIELNPGVIKLQAEANVQFAIIEPQ